MAVVHVCFDMRVYRVSQNFFFGAHLREYNIICDVKNTQTPIQTCEAKVTRPVEKGVERYSRTDIVVPHHSSKFIYTQAKAAPLQYFMHSKHSHTHLTHRD